MSVSDFLESGNTNIDVNNLVVNGTATINGSPIPAPPTSTILITDVDGPWAGPEPTIASFSLQSGGTGVMLVFCTLTGVDDTATAATYITGPVVPVAYRPMSDVNIPFSVFDNGVFQTGVFNVNPDGTMYISTAGSNNFSGMGATGFSTQTLTWATTS